MCETDARGWPGHVIDNLRAIFGVAGEPCARLAVGGANITTIKNMIDSELTNRTSAAPGLVLINMGANDVADPYYSLLTEAGWKADYQYVIDAIHTKWPDAVFYIGKGYRYNSQIPFAVINAWIDDLVTTNSSFCNAGLNLWPLVDGHPEWFSDVGGNPGGVHLNHAGCVVAANAWMTTLGYT